MGCLKLTYYNYRDGKTTPPDNFLKVIHKKGADLKKYPETYPFGFGGQEKDNEVYGDGNLYTAQFWEYDARLGRRWNVDPVTLPSLSSYATLGDNPIFYIDPYGLAPGDFKGWLRKTFTKAKHNTRLRKHDQTSDTKVFTGKSSTSPPDPVDGFRATGGGRITMHRSSFDRSNLTTGARTNPSDPSSNTLNSWLNYYTNKENYTDHSLTLNKMTFGVSQTGYGENAISYNFNINSTDFASQIQVTGLWNCGEYLNDGFLVTGSTILSDFGSTGKTAISVPVEHQIKLTLTANFQGNYKYLTFRRLNGAGNYVEGQTTRIMAPWFQGGAAPWNGGYFIMPKLYRQSRMYELAD